jgi:transposase
VGNSQVETSKKKCKKLGITLIFLDESGFSLSPICGKTWCEVGKPRVLREVYSRHTQTGLGFITMTPEQQRLNFRFTIFPGAINTDDVIFYLRMIHHHYNNKVMIIFDRLPSHISAQKFFEREHPDWFLFEYLPSYSPELNPVEQCWNQMKNVIMVNFVPFCIEDIVAKTLEAAQIINKDPKLIAASSCFVRVLFLCTCD